MERLNSKLNPNLGIRVPSDLIPNDARAKKIDTGNTQPEFVGSAPEIHDCHHRRGCTSSLASW